MTSLDVVDVLRQEHEQIQRLCAEIPEATGDRKRNLFADLQQLVHQHELGERAVVYPAVSDSTPSGDGIGLACRIEGAGLEQSLAGLGRLGVGHPDFDDRFAAFRRAQSDHAAHEERDEFPLLRLYVPAQRLHMMAGAMYDIRVMSRG
jgi:hemerythrin superfamily protein